MQKGDMLMWEMSCEHKGSDQDDASTNQGTSRIDRKLLGVKQKAFRFFLTQIFLSQSSERSNLPTL